MSTARTAVMVARSAAASMCHGRYRWSVRSGGHDDGAATTAGMNPRYAAQT